MSEPTRPATAASKEDVGANAEPMMLLHAQCGRRHFPSDDVAANVAAYKQAFGLAPETMLVGRVHRQFDAGRQPIDRGEPIEVALASATELAAKSLKPQHRSVESQEERQAP
ncbi:MAG TPA: hypothetical protein VEI07_18625 [Planctomycetaceae bacterium]|nr:hypothetical protein [Planctomycetaceae bacterium]